MGKGFGKVQKKIIETIYDLIKEDFSEEKLESLEKCDYDLQDIFDQIGDYFENKKYPKQIFYSSIGRMVRNGWFDSRTVTRGTCDKIEYQKYFKDAWDNKVSRLKVITIYLKDGKIWNKKTGEIIDF